MVDPRYKLRISHTEAVFLTSTRVCGNKGSESGLQEHGGGFRALHRVPRLSLEEELELDKEGRGQVWTWPVLGELPGLGVAHTWTLSRCRTRALEETARSQGIIYPHFKDLNLEPRIWVSKRVEIVSFMFFKNPFIWKEDAEVSLSTGNRILSSKKATWKSLRTKKKGQHKGYTTAFSHISKKQSENTKGNNLISSLQQKIICLETFKE